jgi:U3 small nucleolar RNA-associated protein 12
MGYNIAALRFLKGRWEGEKVAGMMIEEGLDEERVREKIGGGKAKRKRVEVRA